MLNKILGVGGIILTISTMILGVGRYIGKQETRIQQLEERLSTLEEKDMYIHGKFEVPKVVRR